MTTSLSNKSTLPGRFSSKNYLVRTRGFLRTQLWVWPLIAALVLGFLGFWLRVRMESMMKRQVGSTLETILVANTEALQSWAVTMKSYAEIIANDPRVDELFLGLRQRAAGATSPGPVLLNSPELGLARDYINPWFEHRGFDGFILVTTNGLVVAASRDSLVGEIVPPEQWQFFTDCLAGKSIVTRPFTSLIQLPDEQGRLRVGLATMFAAAPILSAEGHVVGLAGLRIVPHMDFSRILATARAGETGETYAFGRDGLQLSESRFTDNLKRLGLIPDSVDAHSTLTLEVRDPLVDLSSGRQPAKRRAELPLTRAVSDAIEGHSGESVAGYRNYLGVPVVGAWEWLPEFDMGLVTEMDVAEALQPLHMMRVGFWSIFGLLTLGSVIVFILMRMSARLQVAARSATLKAKQLGQYALDEKIGAGAFGSVYRAHHALMRRPVAVKLLDIEKADDSVAARFEREVQLTSQLTHPNTIMLYDYGRTPEGLFYYAMEYLEGLTIDKLVKRFGAQPEGRVIFILRQMCNSLAEAHGIGLVHRDIKPANIFLTRRGGVPDFVKVLDFGLVKARDSKGQVELTGADVTLGTPLYMSPEAVEHPEKVDGRSDLYSLGAVGYFILTGQPLFDCGSLGEVLLHQVKEMPMTPSARLGKPVSQELESVLMRCLAKKPGSRPATAEELESMLSRCPTAGDWTRQSAEEWWSKHAAAQIEKTVIVNSPPGSD